MKPKAGRTDAALNLPLAAVSTDSRYPNLFFSDGQWEINVSDCSFNENLLWVPKPGQQAVP